MYLSSPLVQNMRLTLVLFEYLFFHQYSGGLCAVIPIWYRMLLLQVLIKFRRWNTFVFQSKDKLEWEWVCLLSRSIARQWTPFLSFHENTHARSLACPRARTLTPIETANIESHPLYSNSYHEIRSFVLLKFEILLLGNVRWMTVIDVFAVLKGVEAHIR